MKRESKEAKTHYERAVEIAERASRGVKDSELKHIAFQKVLNHLLFIGESKQERP